MGIQKFGSDELIAMGFGTSYSIGVGRSMNVYIWKTDDDSSMKIVANIQEIMKKQGGDQEGGFLA